MCLHFLDLSFPCKFVPPLLAFTSYHSWISYYFYPKVYLILQHFDIISCFLCSRDVNPILSYCLAHDIASFWSYPSQTFWPFGMRMLETILNLRFCPIRGFEFRMQLQLLQQLPCFLDFVNQPVSPRPQILQITSLHNAKGILPSLKVFSFVSARYLVLPF